MCTFTTGSATDITTNEADRTCFLGYSDVLSPGGLTAVGVIYHNTLATLQGIFADLY